MKILVLKIKAIIYKVSKLVQKMIIIFKKKKMKKKV